MFSGKSQCFIQKNGLDMDSTTFHRIVKHEIKFHSYKIHLRHELFRNDCDEAAFHSNGRVNTHNVNTTLLEIRLVNLILIFEFLEKKSQFGWACLEMELQFDQYASKAIWLEIPIIIYWMNKWFQNFVKNHGNRMNRMWWIQDGAPIHRTIPVRNLLTDGFNTRIIAVNY